MFTVLTWPVMPLNRANSGCVVVDDDILIGVLLLELVNALEHSAHPKGGLAVTRDQRERGDPSSVSNPRTG